MPESSSPTPSDQPLHVWGERRDTADWDRFIASLIALSLRAVCEQAEDEEADA